MEQAENDLRAAEHLLAGGFFPHATVMAHLAVEKALKGACRARHDRNPPVTHNLTHLAERAGLALPETLRTALDELSGVSILRLYSDRAFGTGLARGAAPARERVAAAHALLNWITDRI